MMYVNVFYCECFFFVCVWSNFFYPSFKNLSMISPFFFTLKKLSRSAVVEWFFFVMLILLTRKPTTKKTYLILL